MGSLLSFHCSNWYYCLVFLASLQRCSLVSAGNFSDPSLTPIPRDLYHSSDALLEEIRTLVGRHPDKLDMEMMRAGNKDYSAEILVVTYSRARRDIDHNLKFRILLSFGQHGRELITSEVALRLLYILSGEHRVLGMDPISLNNTLDNLVIKMVPMENFNGRKLVESGDLCERRNGRGVDLNRNWSVDWGKKEKDFDPYEENPGKAPFSEPEAQMMQKLSKSFDPHIWVNVHSGMEALFMPYDHKNATPDGFTSRLMKSILEDLNYRHCRDRCLIGSGGGSVGYLAHGTSTDYMYDIVKVPLAFTFEIYGDPEAPSKDCFKMFNPIDITTFSKVLDDWSAAFLMVFVIGPHRLDRVLVEISAEAGKWNSIDRGAVDGGSTGRSRESRKMEGLELGMQELRTYFSLLMLSLVLLLFLFCSRSKCRHAKSSMPL